MQLASQFAVSGAAAAGAAWAGSPGSLGRYWIIDSAGASIYFSCWIFIITD